MYYLPLPPKKSILKYTLIYRILPLFISIVNLPQIAVIYLSLQ